MAMVDQKQGGPVSLAQLGIQELMQVKKQIEEVFLLFSFSFAQVLPVPCLSFSHFSRHFSTIGNRPLQSILDATRNGDSKIQKQ